MLWLVIRGGNGDQRSVPGSTRRTPFSMPSPTIRADGWASRPSNHWIECDGEPEDDVAARLELRKFNTKTNEVNVHSIDDPAPSIMAGGIGGVGWHQYKVVTDSQPDPVPKRSMDKPPYRIPLMAEINAVEPNGFTVASTFAGCGGSSLGYRMAGFRVGYASEFIPAAGDTYEANKREWTHLDRRDIRQVKAGDVLSALSMMPRQLDCLDGSPPCASFSMAGKRSALWGATKTYSDTTQRVDDLFGEYLRLVKALQPKVAVAENVPGLTIGVARGFYNEIMQGFEDAGYVAEAAILEAEWLGVPQARHRLFFVAVRKDLAAAGIRPAFPEPMRYYYSIRDALPHIGHVRHDDGASGKRGSFDAENPAEAKSPRALDLDPATDPLNTLRHASGRAGNHYVVEAEPGSGEAMGLPVADYIPGGARVTARNGAGFAEVEVNTDKPAPAIRATDGDWEGGRGTHLAVETVTARTGPGFAREEQPLDLPAPTVRSGVGPHGHGQGEGLLVEAVTDIGKYAIGREWDNINGVGQSEKFFQLVRPDTEKPCPTVTATAGDVGAASVVHPVERRKFAVAELKRLCGFPDDFILTGSYSQQVERLGRAVMPPVTAALGRTIAEKILKPWAEHCARKQAA